MWMQGLLMGGVLALALGRSLLGFVKQLHQWLMWLKPDKQTFEISLPPGLGNVTFTQDRKYMSKIMKKARKGCEGYRRFNPLGKLQCLRKSGCLDNLLDFVDEIDPSLFVQLQGKQRTKYKKMVQEFGGMQMTQDKLETLLEEVDRALEKFIPDGTAVRLFKIIQKVVFEVQLKMMYGCPLPEGVSIDEFLKLVNGSFGGLYGLKGPSKEELGRLLWIVKEMYERAGKDSMAQHLRGKKKMPEATIRSNLLVLLLIGAQSLGNGGHWLLVELDKQWNPGCLEKVRADMSRLRGVLLEVLRKHPPSSPLLMPIEHPGGYLVFCPPWNHNDPRNFPCPHSFKEDRFDHDLKEAGGSSCPWMKGMIPSSELEAVSAVARNRTCSFGIGPYSCPMRGFFLAILLAMGSRILEKYEYEVTNLQKLRKLKPTEYMLAQTVNRPSVELVATFRVKPFSHFSQRSD